MCLAQLAQCDVFVGLVGHYYGSSPPSDEKSFTEHEYDAAFNLDRLMFLAPQDFPVAASLRESEDKWQRQQAFRDRISTEYVVDKFTSPEELATQVVTALTNWDRAQPKISVSMDPGQYIIVVQSPNACEAHKAGVDGGTDGTLRPNRGERHILWAMFISIDNPIPIILDFRNGSLPKEVIFSRCCGASYKPRLGESWVTAGINEPRFEEIVGGEIALVLEPSRTNYFLDSSKPKDSFVCLGKGQYTIWMEGSGQLKLSNGVTGTVHEGRPLTFDLDQTFAVHVSVIGEVERVQLENGDYATSYIETAASPVPRIADGVASAECGGEIYEKFMAIQVAKRRPVA